jgi:ABC-type glycerol-3-phosphate transport system substrate-binding protein
MTKIALTAAALLVATGAAFAGSDHYGSATQPAASVDTSFTASIKSDANAQKPVVTGANHDLFGNH